MSARLARREALDVRVGEAGELLAADVDPVAVLVDVALERDLDLDEPRPQPLGACAIVGRQLMARAAEVTEPVFEQPGPLSGRSFASSVAAKARTASYRSVRNDRDAPLVEPPRPRCRRRARPNRCGPARERAATVGADERGAGQLERASVPPNDGAAATAPLT